MADPINNYSCIINNESYLKIVIFIIKNIILCEYFYRIVDLSVKNYF